MSAEFTEMPEPAEASGPAERAESDAPTQTIGPIDVRELLARPGSIATHRVQGVLEDAGNELVTVSVDPPPFADLQLASLADGILAKGQLFFTLDVRCARCLKEETSRIEAPMRELFVADPEEEAGEYPLDAAECLLDPEQMIRDTIGLTLPFSPLCRPDCQGLCETCGGDRNLGECPGHEEADPRWAALEALFPEPRPTD